MPDDWKIKCLVPDLPGTADVIPYLQRMDATRWYSNFGPLVNEFETRMGQLLGDMSAACTCAPLTATFSSATMALELVLRASGLPDNARVLLPALTFSATASAIAITGHKPVFSDVDDRTWDLTPEIARAALKHGQIDAVMPVAIYGYPVDMEGWAAFKAETGIPVFVDAAAALGNQQIHPEIPVVFSLHATKPFGIGEGGLLVTGDHALLDQCQKLSNFAFDDGTSRAVGTNGKMPEAMAAYGLAQIERFTAVQAKRQNVLNQYIQYLGREHFHPATSTHVPGTLLYDTRGNAEKLTRILTENAIQTRKWYFPPVQEHEAYAGAAIIGDRGTALPVTESLKPRLVGLPFHAFLDENDIAMVAHHIHAVSD
ncbi:DegT/DnrJ/EryC1/StrS family aminotransferase [Kordiimonas sp.]|uniref:DegT/DnrJ/EryC1/StrS family aminotransferase n=1 Tax=Kordiimonas sp. TaxID=1970157 RepID=UPI003A8E83EE